MIDAKTAVESIVLNIANIVIMFLIVRFLVYKPVIFIILALFFAP